MVRAINKLNRIVTASAVFFSFIVGCASAESTAPTAAAPAQTTPSTAPAAPAQTPSTAPAKSTQDRVDDAVQRLLKAAEKAAEKQAQQAEITDADVEVVAVASAYAEVNGFDNLHAAAAVVCAAPDALAKADPLVAPQAAVVLRDVHNSWVAAQVGADGRGSLSNPNWVGATWELSQVDTNRAKRSLWLQLELERIAEEEENPTLMRRFSNWWNRP